MQNIDYIASEYTQTPAYDIEDNVLHLQNYLLGGYRQLSIDYVSGWNASGVGILEVKDITELGGKIVTVGGQVLTEGVDWHATTDKYTAASSLTDALNANNTIAGLARSFACGAKVYTVDKIVGQEDTVAISTSATANGMTLTAKGGKLTGVDFPEGIKAAIMMYVSVLFNVRKNPKLVSYSIGSKRVQFASDTDFTMFKDLLSPFKNMTIRAI